MKINTLIMVIIMLALMGCSVETHTDVAAQCSSATCKASLAPHGTVEKIEVYHFHRTSQCYSCETVGAYAEETVNMYFSDEVKSGKIMYGHINVELAENMEVVAKYNVTGAGLWIGVYDQNGFHKEENVNVWYKISNKDEYMAYLKGVIEQKLSGN